MHAKHFSIAITPKEKPFTPLAVKFFCEPSRKLSEKIPAASQMAKAICNANFCGVESHSLLKQLVEASVTS